MYAISGVCDEGIWSRADTLVTKLCLYADLLFLSGVSSRGWSSKSLYLKHSLRCFDQELIFMNIGDSSSLLFFARGFFGSGDTVFTVDSSTSLSLVNSVMFSLLLGFFLFRF